MRFKGTYFALSNVLEKRKGKQLQMSTVHLNLNYKTSYTNLFKVLIKARVVIPPLDDLK